MKHLPFSPTPVTPLPYFSREWGLELSCKRDDLFAAAGGGNKARMLQYILADVSPRNVDVLLTAGGPNSNFNRACALMCAQLGVPMHLVEYTDKPREYDTSLNYFICKLTGMRTTRCRKEHVAETIEEVRNQYNKQGVRVKFVYGGGKSTEGVYAYYDAVRELHEQQQEIDELYIACGTGTTLTGVCAGMQHYYPHAVVNAVSIARSHEEEKPVLAQNMEMLNAYLGSNYSFSNLVFSDAYRCGGYAEHCPSLLECVQECAAYEGMLIDPTYSGKAFWAMKEKITNIGGGCGKEGAFLEYRRHDEPACCKS